MLFQQRNKKYIETQTMSLSNSQPTKTNAPGNVNVSASGVSDIDSKNIPGLIKRVKLE